MTVKDRVLDALEANRGAWFSGQALAQTLGVSRSAVWKAISQLREGGYPIRAASNRGYSLEADSAILSAQSVGKYLTAPGVTVEVRPTVTSTNDLLRQQAEAGAPEGTVLIATEQTAGKGRRGHSFFSPPDTGLYLSLLLRPALEAREALSLTTCAAAAVALAIEECAGIPAQIKWVNDVFCRGKKVCGILTEASLDLESGGLQYAIVGIGVNLSPRRGAIPRSWRRSWGRCSTPGPRAWRPGACWRGASWTGSSPSTGTSPPSPFLTTTKSAPSSWAGRSRSWSGARSARRRPWTWTPTSPCGSGRPTGGCGPCPPGRCG